MKTVKRLLTCIVSLAIVLNVLVLPAATVNADSSGIATLTVQDFYRTWASASTYSDDTVTVSLSIDTYNTVDGTYFGNATGSTGFISVSVGLSAGTNSIVMSASSSHYDRVVRMNGSWSVDYGYSFYYC
jgi:hypothetical protein